MRLTFILIVTIIAGAASGLHFLGHQRILNPPTFTVAQIPSLTTPSALARGAHLAQAVAGCADCHGQNLAGGAQADAPPGAELYAPNLTTGDGSAVGGYTDSDWVRAIAHGVGGDGRALVIMPSQHYATMSAYDLGALIGYLKTLPDVDNKLPATKIGFPSTILIAVLDELAVRVIDHAAVATAIADTSSAIYLTTVSGCVSCHGARLAGRTGPPGPPGGPNLTSLDWSVEEFIEAMVSGLRPDGTEMAATMPWRTLGQMERGELEVIWQYVLGLPDRVDHDND